MITSLFLLRHVEVYILSEMCQQLLDGLREKLQRSS